MLYFVFMDDAQSTMRLVLLPVSIEVFKKS